MVIKMRAIDAEELHNALFRLGGNISLEAFTRFERLILGAPTVEPVKCGKWEKMPQLCRWWICTQCNHIINRVVLPHYCECCGSKMDGGKE